jgi:hypothetical protein
MTLFNFSVVTSLTDELKGRLDRIRTLLQRLNRVRDSAVEAEIITELTLETEAVRRVRAALALHGKRAVSGAEHAAKSDRLTTLPDARP